MKYAVKFTKEFKHDLKMLKKRGVDIDKVLAVVDCLAEGNILDEQYRDHALLGNYVNCRECHVENDLLLIYSKRNDILVLTCLETGTHSDLFR